MLLFRLLLIILSSLLPIRLVKLFLGVLQVNQALRVLKRILPMQRKLLRPMQLKLLMMQCIKDKTTSCVYSHNIRLLLLTGMMMATKFIEDYTPAKGACKITAVTIQISRKFAA